MESQESMENKALEELAKEGVLAGGSQKESKNQFYIIYLDDEEDALDPVVDIIVEFGFKAYTCQTIDAALGFVEKHQHEIAYIISDYKISDLNGFNFREKLIPIAADIPFVILSGNITKELAMKGLDLKISEFIAKPMNSEKFAEIILKDGISRVKSIKEDRELLECFGR